MANCDYKVQTPAGMFPCQETIEHEHIGPGAQETFKLSGASQKVDLSEVWKEISRLQDIIKQVSNKLDNSIRHLQQNGKWG